MSRRSQRRGFTLVELLVALAIGLFLTAGMVQMYVSNKLTYRFSESLSRMQESGRFALELIARDMRMTDFWGCSGGNNLTVHLNAGCTTPTAGPASTNAIAGADGAAGTPDAPDSITLRGSVGTGLIVATGTTTTTLNVQGTVANARDVLGDTTNRTGDIALVSDCQGGDLFQATSLTGGSPTVVGIATGYPATPPSPPGSPGNATNTLSNLYDQTAALHRWREVRYFIQNGANGDPALFFQENQCANGATREVVEGVENMQITYGEDIAPLDGTADRYVPAANVTDMDAVVSVRIELLLRSADDGLTDQAQQVVFNGQTFTAGDRRIYQVVTATFALRNRTL